MKSSFSPNAFGLFLGSMSARIAALKVALPKDRLEIYEAELAKLKEKFIKDKNLSSEELQEIDDFFM